MQNLKSQNGRSMVEMLGVLAIIGVLSVGGVYGYGVAMKKHKANNALHQASMLATTVSAYAMSNDGNLPSSIADFANLGYDTSVTDDGTKFKLTISGLDDGVCEQLQNLQGGMMRSVECSEPDADNKVTATLSYYKNLATNDIEGANSPTGGSSGGVGVSCSEDEKITKTYTGGFCCDSEITGRFCPNEDPPQSCTSAPICSATNEAECLALKGYWRCNEEYCACGPTETAVACPETPEPCQVCEETEKVYCAVYGCICVPEGAYHQCSDNMCVFSFRQDAIDCDDKGDVCITCDDPEKIAVCGNGGDTSCICGYPGKTVCNDNSCWACGLNEKVSCCGEGEAETCFCHSPSASVACGEEEWGEVVYKICETGTAIYCREDGGACYDSTTQKAICQDNGKTFICDNEKVSCCGEDEAETCFCHSASASVACGGEEWGEARYKFCETGTAIYCPEDGGACYDSTTQKAICHDNGKTFICDKDRDFICDDEECRCSQKDMSYVCVGDYCKECPEGETFSCGRSWWEVESVDDCSACYKASEKKAICGAVSCQVCGITETADCGYDYCTACYNPEQYFVGCPDFGDLSYCQVCSKSDYSGVICPEDGECVCVPKGYGSGCNDFYCGVCPNNQEPICSGYEEECYCP